MADDKKDKPAHTLADHLYGRDVVHVHADDSDHDHDHDFDDDDGPLEDNPLWRQDNVTLTTVGIDIGSSGTQVIFSRVHLRRLAEDLTSRYYVVSRETLFQSPVALTPYQSEERIDDQKLGVIIDDAYVAAGLSPDQIDTGVVILTGEALRRDNAQGIAKILSEQGGEFVTATAGHHMEAMLAAYGSGAARVSSDGGKRILNIDIGGGTTKLGLVENGKVIATAAVHIGGRLQVVEDGKIVRLDPAGKHHAKRAGFSWNRGDAVTAADLDKVADGMADALVAAVTARPLPHDIAQLYLTDPIAELDAGFGRIDGVMFSGGVGEYVYEREARDFGDLGARTRPRHCRAHRARRLSLAGAAGRRVHPRHRARRLGIQRAAFRQHQLHFRAGPIVAAPQSPGRAAALRSRRKHRSRATGAGDPRPRHRIRPRRHRPRHRAGVALDRTAVLSAARRLRRRHQKRAGRAASPRSCRSTSCSTATWRRRSAISCATSCMSTANSW